MISKLSDRLVKWLSNKGTITADEKTLFSYAAYSLLFGMAPVIITIVLGLLFDMLKEGLFMILPFMLIRKFSGGYHLGSAKICCILSTAVLLIAFFLMKMFISLKTPYALLVLVLVATLCIMFLSPIDSSARRLSTKEVRIFKAIAQMLSILFCTIYIVLVLNEKGDYATPIGVGITIVASLQLPCLWDHVIKQLRERKNTFTKT